MHVYRTLINLKYFCQPQHTDQDFYFLIIHYLLGGIVYIYEVGGVGE